MSTEPDQIDDNHPYTDFIFYADNVNGMDWKAQFFYCAETGGYAPIEYAIAEPHEPYEETDIPPPETLKSRVEAYRLKRMTEAAAPQMKALLDDAVIFLAEEYESDSEVDGADLVEWFGDFRRKAQNITKGLNQ